MDVVAYNLEVAPAVEQIDPAGASIHIGQTGHLKVLDADVRRAALNHKTGAGFSVPSSDLGAPLVLRPEDNPFVRRAASRDTDDHFAVAIVRPSVGINAVVYQDCIAGFDAVSGFLNCPERARFGAGVGVGAGRRDMVSGHSALRSAGDCADDGEAGDAENRRHTFTDREKELRGERNEQPSHITPPFDSVLSGSSEWLTVQRPGMSALLRLNTDRSAALNDLPRLLGMITTSLAFIATSSCLPFIILAASTLISCFFLVTGSSRKMIARSEAAVDFIPCASVIACMNVAPSLNVKEPGAFTSPPTKKTSACGIWTMLLGSRRMFLSRSPLKSPLILTFINSYLSRSSAS